MIFKKRSSEHFNPSSILWDQETTTTTTFHDLGFWEPFPPQLCCLVHENMLFALIFILDLEISPLGFRSCTIKKSTMTVSGHTDQKN